MWRGGGLGATYLAPFVPGYENGLTLFWNFLQSFGEEFLAGITGGRIQSKWSKTWLKLGGRMALPLSQDTNLSAQAARDVVESKNIGRRIVRYVADPKNIPRHLWNDWNGFISFWKDLLQFRHSLQFRQRSWRT